MYYIYWYHTGMDAFSDCFSLVLVSGMKKWYLQILIKTQPFTFRFAQSVISNPVSNLTIFVILAPRPGFKPVYRPLTNLNSSKLDAVQVN